MDKKKKKHIALAIGGIGVLSIAGYLLYKHEHPASVAISPTPSTPALPSNPNITPQNANPTHDTGDSAVGDGDSAVGDGTDVAAGSDSADPSNALVNS